jgi:hypothetical protein
MFVWDRLIFETITHFNVKTLKMTQKVCGKNGDEYFVKSIKFNRQLITVEEEVKSKEGRELRKVVNCATSSHLTN